MKSASSIIRSFIHSLIRLFFSIRSFHSPQSFRPYGFLPYGFPVLFVKMLANVMGAIGLVGDVLGIVGFAMDNMAPSSPNGATMRIKAGLNDHEEEQKVR